MTTRDYDETAVRGKPYFGPSARDLEYIRGCATLYAYLRRIDARVKNFRRFVVEEHNEDAYRGWRTLATIQIKPDGTVDCSHPDHAPTPDEAGRIAEEVKAVQFPPSIDGTLGSVDRLKETHLQGVPDKDIVPFMAENGRHVKFVQQRTYKADGIEKAADLPWTFFGDCEWRMMEPDNGLPLWGLDGSRHSLYFLVHEGAMGAMKIRRMVEEGGEGLANHPWCEELKRATHLAWPGGTDRVYDVDWSYLKKLGPERIVDLVADHDRKGQEAIPHISRILSRSLGVIMFDDHFPPTFDLADPWPQHERWWRKGRYVGPTFDDLRTSATWATAEVKVQSSGQGRRKSPHIVQRTNSRAKGFGSRISTHSSIANRRTDC
jgi:hypothetical protein